MPLKRKKYALNILGCVTSCALSAGMSGACQLNFMDTNNDNKVGNHDDAWNLTFSWVLHWFKIIHQMLPRAAQNIQNQSSNNEELFHTFSFGIEQYSNHVRCLYESSTPHQTFPSSKKIINN